jgi:arylsulfatase
MACITEGSAGFPGFSARIPFENGTIAEVLGERGWNTYAIGKWHLTPADEIDLSAWRARWPLGRGFERFYGFLGGETNQWYPLLVQDNQSVDQPYMPEQGYHFTKDITDRALQYIRDGRAADPEKPWFLYFAPGAAHAPHHVPKEWADKYKGKFDMGYERYREEALARQIAMGVVPAGTTLPPMNPYAGATGPQGQPWPSNDVVRPWDSLDRDEKRLFCRMAEVYAGFVSHCDHHIGRLLDYLEENGDLNNTIIVVVSDNGASGEGGPNGTVNEMKFFNGVIDTIQENLKYVDELGSPKTYNHYNTGWAQAFCTPFKMFKRYANYEGGTADPMIVAWPKGIQAKGEIRHQYCHAIDIVPTLYQCLDIEPPDVVHGYTQSEIEGVSFAHTFHDAGAPTRKQAQFYSMLGTRGVWLNGWHASTVHPACSGWGGFDKDRWELFHLDEDRAQNRDLSAQYPERLEEMKQLWAFLAGKYQALPLDDRTAVEVIAEERPRPGKPRDQYVYYPDCAPVPQGVAANPAQRSFAIAAQVDIHDGQAEGVIFAQGSDIGGHTLYVKDGQLNYVYNWLGEVQQKITSSEPVPSGKHTLKVSFEIEGHDSTHSPLGSARLFIDDRQVAADHIKTQPGFFGLEGVVTVGRDIGRPPSDDYQSPDTFRGGVVEKVIVAIVGSPHTDPGVQAEMASRRD